MPSKKSISGQVNPGIILVVSYFVLFAVNALVITLAHGYFPNQLVLGTTNLTQAWAVILTAGKLALINTFAIPFIRQYELRRGKMLTPSDWMIIYFILNFVGIWLITRFPIQFGTGIRVL